MSEPYNYRPSAPPQPGRPQGWTGTSKMPMQALGAPPPDLQPPSGYGPPYPPPERPRNRRPGGFLRDRGKLVDFTLKGLGLVGVALVSGFLWYLIRNDPAAPSQANTNQPQQTTGIYAFQPYQGASMVTDCANHATDRVRAYLVTHPCTSLTRSLYTASLTDGDKVITSVAVVKMNTQAAAKGLRQVSDADNSGHVKDLVEEGTVIPGGPNNLQNAGYVSRIKGTDVIIIMTEYVDNNQDSQNNLNANDTTLKAVSSDAAKQNLGVS